MLGARRSGRKSRRLKRSVTEMTAVPIGRDSYMPCAHATSPAIQSEKLTLFRLPQASLRYD
jgi:hypothetical protein